MATAIIMHQLQKRLPKVISPDVHGVFDYAHAAFFAAAAVFLWKRNRAASLAALATAGLTFGEAWMTDYPLGVEPVIDFETHGKLDAALASAALLTPQIFGFSKSDAANLFRIDAVVAAAIVGMTDYSGSPSPTAE